MPTFSTNCLDGSHFAQMGSQFAQNPNPNPCSLLSRHTPFWDIYVHNTHPTPKTVNPFFWTKLESGQTELPSGHTGPQLGNMFEKRTKLFYKWAKIFISDENGHLNSANFRLQKRSSQFFNKTTLMVNLQFPFAIVASVLLCS